MHADNLLFIVDAHAESAVKSAEKHADEQIARIAPTENVLFGFAPSRNVSSWQMFGSTKRTYALATSCQEHGFAAVSSAAAVVSNATIH